MDRFISLQFLVTQIFSLYLPLCIYNENLKTSTPRSELQNIVCSDDVLKSQQKGTVQLYLGYNLPWEYSCKTMYRRTFITTCHLNTWGSEILDKRYEDAYADYYVQNPVHIDAVVTKYPDPTCFYTYDNPTYNVVVFYREDVQRWVPNFSTNEFKAPKYAKGSIICGDIKFMASTRTVEYIFADSYYTSEELSISWREGTEMIDGFKISKDKELLYLIESPKRRRLQSASIAILDRLTRHVSSIKTRQACDRLQVLGAVWNVALLNEGQVIRDETLDAYPCERINVTLKVENNSQQFLHSELGLFCFNSTLGELTRCNGREKFLNKTLCDGQECVDLSTNRTYKSQKFTGDMLLNMQLGTAGLQIDTLYQRPEDKLPNFTQPIYSPISKEQNNIYVWLGLGLSSLSLLIHLCKRSRN